MKAIKRLAYRCMRWLFRLCGGYHRTEHEEIVHAQLCSAEKETANLRLYKHNMGQRFKSLNRMLREELEAREQRAKNSR